jgi:hypothetical protein
MRCCWPPAWAGRAGAVRGAIARHCADRYRDALDDGTGTGRGALAVQGDDRDDVRARWLFAARLGRRGARLSGVVSRNPTQRNSGKISPADKQRDRTPSSPRIPEGISQGYLKQTLLQWRHGHSNSFLGKKAASC